MLARWAGRMSFDSMIEKSRQRITTIPIASGMAPNVPGTSSSGMNVTTVVKTPKVAGVATRFAPIITLSMPGPSLSVVLCTLSPMIIASSTTIPKTSINPNRLMRLIDPPASGSSAKAPRNAIGMPSITQNAS